MISTETTKIPISEKPQRIYLASPYTHEDKKVMLSRYKAAVKATADLITRGNIVFSPIVHNHTIAVAFSLPRSYSFWKSYSTSFLLCWAEVINILCLPNWENSIGIKAELVIANEAKLPIHYITI